jgi:uncharacterized protein (TIGR02147 family)
MNIFPEDPRSYLRDEFDRRHKRNPSYSWRSFARDLKLSPSMLSEFLKGRYGLSKGKAAAIAQSIKLDLVNTEHFIDLLEAGFHRLPTQRENARFRAEERLQKSGTAIPAESLKSVLDWSFLSMMEIAGLEQGEPVPDRWAAPFRHLHEKAKEALVRLRDLKLIRDEGGALKASEEVTIAGDQLADEELRGLHAQALELSRLAIEGLGAKERESLTVFGSVRKDDFKDMRKEMNDALLQILNKYASRPGSDSVFCLALQAFPIYSKSP